MDVARYARFERPGHAVTATAPTQLQLDGTRDQGRLRLRHAIVDDHTRLAYVELLEDEKAATVTAFVDRALA